MIRSSRFGSIRSDEKRPIQTRFRLGSGIFSPLTLPLPISRRLILQQARGQILKSSHCLSAYGFMFYFTPLRGFSFTFPSQYFFTIGHSGVFSLTRWSSLIHTGFHVPHATRDFPEKKKKFLTTGLSPSLVQDSAASSHLFYLFLVLDSHNPIAFIQWFRLFPFRSPLLRESLLLSFPLATEMFQFTRLPLPFL